MRKYNIITIERQYASGGHEIGSLLAEKLGIKFYNEQILQMAADKLNIQSDNIKHLEEATTNSFLDNIAKMADFQQDAQFADRLFYAESEIIKDIAKTESCVIVGRCASDILRDRKDCLKVFIYADHEERAKRAVEEYGILEKDTHLSISKVDKRRNAFYNLRDTKKWTSMETYDICLNSCVLGIDNCVEIIASIVNS